MRSRPSQGWLRGGAIKITATTLNNAGRISSDGGPGAGAGSGGAIVLVTGALTNSGTLRVRGGGHTYPFGGPAGGKGRIGIDYVTTFTPGTIDPPVTCNGVANRPRCES